MIDENRLVQNSSSNSNEKFAKSKNEDKQMLEEWLKNREVCRITGVSLYLHDKFTDCAMNSNPYCDICRKRIDGNVTVSNAIAEARNGSPLVLQSPIIRPFSASEKWNFSNQKSPVCQNGDLKSPFIVTPTVQRTGTFSDFFFWIDS